MDTKQLAAFCAVVERSSFSQAADQLGVTQPAVSLQIRSLEQRVGQRLLDRSGRRVEPTEAGLRLYRGAQRLLALEQQLLADLGDEAEGELKGRLEIGASTGPGGSVLPVILRGASAPRSSRASRSREISRPVRSRSRASKGSSRRETSSSPARAAAPRRAWLRSSSRSRASA